MTRDQQLNTLRAEAHRLLDALLDVSSRYYGNKNDADRAAQLDTLTDMRSAMCLVVDAYGAAIGYPETFPPCEAIADELATARKEPSRERVVAMLEDVAQRIAPAQTVVTVSV